MWSGICNCLTCFHVKQGSLQRKSAVSHCVMVHIYAHKAWVAVMSRGKCRSLRFRLCHMYVHHTLIRPQSVEQVAAMDVGHLCQVLHSPIMSPPFKRHDVGGARAHWHCSCKVLLQRQAFRRLQPVSLHTGTRACSGRRQMPVGKDHQTVPAPIASNVTMLSRTLQVAGQCNHSHGAVSTLQNLLCIKILLHTTQHQVSKRSHHIRRTSMPRSEQSHAHGCHTPAPHSLTIHACCAASRALLAPPQTHVPVQYAGDGGHIAMWAPQGLTQQPCHSSPRSAPLLGLVRLPSEVVLILVLLVVGVVEAVVEPAVGCWLWARSLQGGAGAAAAGVHVLQLLQPRFPPACVAPRSQCCQSHLNHMSQTKVAT